MCNLYKNNLELFLEIENKDFVYYDSNKLYIDNNSYFNYFGNNYKLKTIIYIFRMSFINYLNHMIINNSIDKKFLNSCLDNFIKKYNLKSNKLDNLISLKKYIPINEDNIKNNKLIDTKIKITIYDYDSNNIFNNNTDIESDINSEINLNDDSEIDLNVDSEIYYDKQNIDNSNNKSYKFVNILYSILKNIKNFIVSIKNKII